MSRYQSSIPHNEPREEAFVTNRGLTSVPKDALVRNTIRQEQFVGNRVPKDAFVRNRIRGDAFIRNKVRKDAFVGNRVRGDAFVQNEGMRYDSLPRGIGIVRNGGLSAGDGFGRSGGLTSAEKKERKEKQLKDAKNRRMNRTSAEKKADTIRGRIKRFKAKIKAGDKDAEKLLAQAETELAGLGPAGARKPRGRPTGTGKKRTSKSKSKSNSKSKSKSFSGKLASRKSKSGSKKKKSTSLERAPTVPLRSFRTVSVRSVGSSRPSSPKVVPKRSGSKKEDLRYALIVRPRSKTSQEKRAEEALRYALIPRPPSLKKMSSHPGSRPARAESKQVDYKARHERCEQELLGLETDLAKLQEQLEQATEKQNQINKTTKKDLENIIKQSNALLKKFK